MMQANLDSKDVYGVIRTLGGMGVLGVLFYVVLQQVIAHEIAIEQRLVRLEATLEESVEAEQRRFEQFMAVQRETNQWLRANCYAAANGDPDARAECNQVGKLHGHD